MKSRIISAAIAAGVIAGSSGIAAAQSDTDLPDAGDAESSIELPAASTTVTLPGLGITLNVTVDETGHLAEVQLLDAAGAEVPATRTEDTPDEVRFVLQGDGTEVTVEVEADARTDEPKLEIAVERPAVEPIPSSDDDGPGQDRDDQGSDDDHDVVTPRPAPATATPSAQDDEGDDQSDDDADEFDRDDDENDQDDDDMDDDDMDDDDGDDDDGDDDDGDDDDGDDDDEDDDDEGDRHDHGDDDGDDD